MHLTPSAAVVLVIAIFVGGFINIPVKRFTRSEQVSVPPLPVFGLAGVLPQLQCIRHQTVIAVNVGGCLIPAGLAVYELMHLVASGTRWHGKRRRAGTFDGIVLLGVIAAIWFSTPRPS